MKHLLSYSLFLSIFLSLSAHAAPNTDTLFGRAQFYEKLDRDSALFYYNQLLTGKNLREKQPEIYGKALRRKAVLNATINKESENIALCEEAIAIFRQQKNAKETGITLNSLANIYQVKGYYDLAIANYQKAAVIFDSIAFYNGLTICYSNIASIYNHTEQYQPALQYNLLAYQTAVTKNDTFSEGMIAHDVSISFTKNKQPDSAKYYATRALQLGQSIRNDFVTGYAYKAFFELYKSEKMWLLAQTSAQQSLTYLQQTNSRYDVCFAYCNLAESALALQQNTAARDAIQKAATLAEEVHSFQLSKRVYGLYKDIAAAGGDYKNAYAFAQLYQQYSDSVFFEKRNNTLNELETKYQTAQKETQIARQQVEIQEQLIKTKQARIRLAIAVVLFFVLLVGAILLYLFFKQRQTLLQNKIITIEQQKKLELTQAIMDGEETERARLAKELHDGIGGLMSMVKLRFAKIRQTAAGLQQEEDFDKALELLNTASQDIRKISHALMPSALERLGLTEATAQFCHAMESSSRMEIDFQHYGLEERLPQRFELLVYRIIQELLNNIVKYAEAGDVLVQISRHDNQLSITVEDDGKGFDVNIIRQKDGIGLHSMQQRIALLGGRMDIDSAIGKGTSVNIELPVS